MHKVIALFLFSILVSSCNKLPTADYEFYVREDFTIAAGLNTIETHVFIIEDVMPFLSGNLLTQGSDISEVTSISPGRAEIYTSFSGFDLSFIREVSIRVRLSEEPGDSIELFKLDDVRINEDTNISLLNTLAELKDIFDEDQVDLEVRLKLRRFSPTQIPATLNFSYAVFVSG